MSEPYGEPAPVQQGNFLTRKYGGIPGIAWLAGAAVLAYFLFFRNSSSSSSNAPSSSGGGGTSTTGDITLQPGTETIDLSGTTSGNTVSNPAPVPAPDGNPLPPSGPAQTGTPNPQPVPPTPPKKKTSGGSVTHKAGAPPTVTVAQWPGKSVNGLAQWNTTLWGIANHYHTSVQELLKLNPNIKDPNLIQPGQKIKVP